MGDLMTRYECSYCGGWEGDDGLKGNSAALHIKVKHGDEIKVCTKCLIKVFDKVLGKRRQSKWKKI